MARGTGTVSRGVTGTGSSDDASGGCQSTAASSKVRGVNHVTRVHCVTAAAALLGWCFGRVAAMHQCVAVGVGAGGACTHTLCSLLTMRGGHVAIISACAKRGC